MKKMRPPEKGIVQGGIEAYVDPKRPRLGRMNLLCGHCGAYVREGVTLMYQDPADGISMDEQVEEWAHSLASSMRCPKCKVLNVAIDVETYLREQRKLAKKFKALWQKLNRERKKEDRDKPEH